MQYYGKIINRGIEKIRKGYKYGGDKRNKRRHNTT